ncbi:MAG: methyltransferase domain-containing protein [Lachnospiraceae bacterium]|nr:methyltransferase domain-containing protein [Lachnospiraceae bacterium]
MEAYTDFAGVYDELMDDTPYDAWCDRIVEDMEKYGISKPDRTATDPLEAERNLVLDLACGTGTLTRMLYERGYDMIGVDYSEEMLMQARAKQEQDGTGILYLQQDMRELDLYCTIGTVLCICDSLNYLLEEEDLRQTFSLVHNFLYPGGLFLFDCNTDYKYREVIGDTVIAENRDDCSFIWENAYDEGSGINEYDLTVFVKTGEDTWRRFCETHHQHGYDAALLQRLLSENGFELIRIIDSDTGKEPGPETERIYVVARCRKNQEK